MDERVAAAVGQNAAWCDLVCRWHGVPTTTTPGAWAARRRAPALHPDAVALLPTTTAEEVLTAVEAGPGCAVKDSWARLDLAPHGFEELFSAQWVHRAPGPPARGGVEVASEVASEVPGAGAGAGVGAVAVVEHDEALAEWAAAHGNAAVLRPGLLRDPSVRVLAVRDVSGTRTTAGAVAHLSGAVVGLGNVFTTDLPAAPVWAGLVEAVSAWQPGLPLVGYEGAEDLPAAVAAGFVAVGALRVWRRPG